MTVRRHEAGGNSEFDVVRAEGLVAQVRAGIPPLEGQRQAALFQLAALLGRTPAHAPTDVDACVTPPRLDALIPIGVGAPLLRRRPDVCQAERGVSSSHPMVCAVPSTPPPPRTLPRSYSHLIPDAA